MRVAGGGNGALGGAAAALFAAGLAARTVLSAGMIAVRGRIQREGEVVHLVAQRFTDLLAE